ncbi:Ark- serine/threonine protein kinase [Rhodotorula kratochvilovae]
MAYSRPFPAQPAQPYAPSTSPAFRAPAPPAAAPAAAPPPAPVLAAPPGTLPPGTVVDVGQYRVTVQRFLSEGGFAHVYLAQSAVPLPPNSPAATTQHVLKRMVVPDKRGVEEVGREVDVMRQLRNHPKIVNMIEASVADLPGGVDGSKGYEIYILMEWCQGGGIIDMMNTRLQNRLTEGEILKIFSDVVEAVAHMHYQSPPLIHRDLKVENILLSPPQTYKLCDFGSTTRPLPRDKVPTSVEGIQKLEHSINKTTTLQYRAPELVDVWGRKGFDEKIDIWALGVLLYKLCFYTTPFEEHGPLAILNAQYKFPPYPAYSSSIRSLIGAMLQERASQRPNIYQVHEMVCRLRGVPVRLENKYALSPSSSTSLPALSPRGAPLPASPHTSAGHPSSLPTSPLPTASILSSAPAAGVGVGAVPGLSGLANQIAPMRRGRPSKPSASPLAGTGAAAELVPERQVRTGLAEWHKDGEKGEHARGMEWEGFGAPASSGSAGGAGAGFGDAFAPAAAKLEGAATAGGALETSVELPRNAGMFAALQRGASPMAVDGAGGEGAKAGRGEDERRRFEETFPAIELDAPAAEEKADPGKEATMSAPPPTTASLIDAPTPPAPSAAQLTGEQTGDAPGPPLPRRPPTASPSFSPASAPAPAPAPGPKPQRQASLTKPGLVSRGSQTSPHLMAGWKPAQPAATASSASSAPGQQSGLRQSSVPELALEQPEGARPAVRDLLGEDDGAALAELAPALRATPSPTPGSVAAAGSIVSKRASFLGAQPSPSGTGEREKFRPVTKRMSGSPAASPKPALASAPPQAYGRKEPEREKSVEERFPALTLEEPPPAPAPANGAPPRAQESWERVVEKEQDDADSSDEERAPPVPPVKGKVAAPAFDDDDEFAPRRPALGIRTSTGTVPKLTASPPALQPKELALASAAETLSPSAATAERQLSTMSASSTDDAVGGGGIDLGPALASIRKFAPQGNGHAAPSSLRDAQDDFAPSPAPAPAQLVAPKPNPSHRKQAINSLVSRYEGLGSALTGGPPPVGTKPAGLRKDSTGSSTGSGAAHALHTREGVRPQRLPQWGASAEGMKSPVGSVHSVREVPEDNGFEPRSPPLPPKPATPTFAPSAARAPFKPVPPPGSPSSPVQHRPAFGSHASRPSFGTRAPLPQQEPPAARPAPAAGAEGEEEQRFAGVSNMKSRWESMSRPAQDAPPPRGGAPGTQARRRSWAQI